MEWYGTLPFDVALLKYSGISQLLARCRLTCRPVKYRIYSRQKHLETKIVTLIAGF